MPPKKEQKYQMKEAVHLHGRVKKLTRLDVLRHYKADKEGQEFDWQPKTKRKTKDNLCKLPSLSVLP